MIVKRNELSTMNYVTTINLPFVKRGGRGDLRNYLRNNSSMFPKIESTSPHI